MLLQAKLYTEDVDKARVCMALSPQALEMWCTDQTLGSRNNPVANPWNLRDVF